ncbi:aquaporin, putative [Phytophthora infestans T30-4]|uniref:Aquaporin, putative n=1 Tax=Phytophthora infestans (strain T30-4) TaxID=403677 RepID=D0NBW4_PHYIT|nr:aquaporin, putative [Phytophthora infestans T30-4]EEY55269.1 aquaporin, putative [Phytophthora infestans T30-4]|eukprot:XP_002903493.1 aquaporin, putative [Phytophthora infestans T30-4]
MIVFGMGVNNQVANSQDANGTWLSINMCWGIGVLIGVYCSEGISAFIIYVMQYQNLNVIDPSRETTQSSFSTYPSDNISNYTAFYTEFIGTAMLVLSIYAITDKRNRSAGPVGFPFAFCLMIMALGMAFGMNTGYAVNPARDLGPRIFTAIAGWGSKVFTIRNYYFLIPIVADSMGGVCGAGLYRVLVEMHHPQPQPALV